MTPETALKRYFGYDHFRYNQRQIIASVLSHQDTLVILPTGGGKSLCYQIPGTLLKGTVIVVSPLISLMKDQVDRLNSRGILSTYINSSLSNVEIANRMTVMRLGRWKFVYVAPERLLTKRFLSTCHQIYIPLVAVDEAHCISQWGHDFRPEYLHITEFYARLSPRPTIMALTATATPKVSSEIIGSLKLKSPRIFTNSFRRSNLRLDIVACPRQSHKLFYLTYLLKTRGHQPSIVYTQTREAAEDLQALIAIWLPQLAAGVYHGGLSAAQRSQVQEDFLEQKLTTIFATSAFGMGVDKADVRLVAHYQMPSSIEEYYQEIGRAGRDGQPAKCVWLYRPEDISLTAEIALSSLSPDSSHRQHLARQLQEVERFAQASTCRTQSVLNYFGETTTDPCQQCDVCLPTSFRPTFIEKKQFQQLQTLVKKLANQHHWPEARIATHNLLHWLLLLRPRTKNEFLALPGIGSGWTEMWSDAFSSFFTELGADL